MPEAQGNDSVKLGLWNRLALAGYISLANLCRNSILNSQTRLSSLALCITEQTVNNRKLKKKDFVYSCRFSATCVLNDQLKTHALCVMHSALMQEPVPRLVGHVRATLSGFTCGIHKPNESFEYTKTLRAKHITAHHKSRRSPSFRAMLATTSYLPRCS